jgi:CBS domain-containing protein
MPTATTRASANRFLDLTAADLMTTPVRTIPQDTSLREAAHLLTRDQISGAPVVDADGRCIGVLSFSDFVTWAEKGEEAGEGGEVISFIAPWGEIINIEHSADQEIRHYMTAQPVTVAPTASIGELAQMRSMPISTASWWWLTRINPRGLSQVPTSWPPSPARPKKLPWRTTESGERTAEPGADLTLTLIGKRRSRGFQRMPG